VNVNIARRILSH